MAVKLYDEAIVNKLKKWIKDPNLRLLKPDETTRFFESVADETHDEPLSLPLISISRDKNIEILNLEKQPKTFDGYCIEGNASRSISLDVIPIQIGYQIDIYTKGIEEADEYVRNFVFNLINYPKLVVEIPYNNVNIRHESTIHLESSIADNSDIREHLFPDQFVRFTIKFIVDDAYLFSAPVRETPKIEVGDLQVIDRDTKEVVEESRIFDSTQIENSNN